MLSIDLTISQEIILALGVVLSTEAFSRLPFRTYLAGLLKLFRSIYKTLNSSRISDHWKEVAMIKYATKLLRYGAIILLLSLTTMIPIALSIWFLFGDFNNSIAFSYSLDFLIRATIIACVYFILKRRYYV